MFTFTGSLALWKDRVSNAALKDPGAGYGKDKKAFSLLSQRKSGLAVWETKPPPTQVGRFHDVTLQPELEEGWLAEQSLCKRLVSETHFILESLTYGLEERTRFS